MARLFAECAASYCPSLDKRQLAACKGVADDLGQRYLDFGELTVAVLELEYGKEAAQEISAHLIRLSTPVVLIDSERVLLDGVELIKLDNLPADPKWKIGPLFDALTRSAGQGATGLALVIRARKDVSVHHLNSILRTAKAAGYEHFSFCAMGTREEAPKVDETCSPLTL